LQRSRAALFILMTFECVPAIQIGTSFSQLKSHRGALNFVQAYRIVRYLVLSGRNQTAAKHQY
jgi:hypothetical protein